MNYLFDTSAFLDLIRKKRLIVNSYILDLTIYEIGNAIWKETVLFNALSWDEAIEFMRNISNILNKMIIIHIDVNDLNEIIKIAIQERLTFYDSAYLYYARKNKLILVTNDKKLYNTAKNKIKVLNSYDL